MYVFICIHTHTCAHICIYTYVYIYIGNIGASGDLTSKLVIMRIDQFKLYLDMPKHLVSLICTYCNTLQHTATHCNTLQHTATHCNTLHLVSLICMYCNTLHLTAPHCTSLHLTAPHCTSLQQNKHPPTQCVGFILMRPILIRRGKTHCNTLQHAAPHTAIHCNTLQHTATCCTHCNT